MSELIRDYNLSLNLSSGVTGSVHGIELSLISSYNYQSFQGIQVSGFANISGANNILNPKEKLEETFRGFQFAGLMNKTFGDGTGWQLASFNIAESSFKGFQMALISNKARDMTGIQLAGLINSSVKGFGGIQMAPLFNYSGGQSYGMQIALFNYARSGGLINSRKTIFTDFYQIGLINFSKVNNGNQIGLINITEKNNGVPLGLINIDASHGNASFRATDMFLSNLAISTGSAFYTNLIQVGYNFSITGMPVWGLAYGLEKEWKNTDKNKLISLSLSLWQQKEKDEKLLEGPRILRTELIYGFKITKFRFLEIGAAFGYQLNESTALEPTLLPIGKVLPGFIMGIR
ncbi:hypothetical protein [Marivirga aurantiaca]|uniref:hypothetical protein n=1 Tax=Marivirga aurantiaca TaxID=2802615 RepID=UPI0019176297|nr:hypothetical protein [Marivirga aurantiaca]